MVSSSMRSNRGGDTMIAWAVFLGTGLVYTSHLISRSRSSTSKEKKNPNPQLISKMTKEEAHAIRKQHFGGNVSLSYANSGPLMIMGGSKSRLMDETGKWYLDTRNNVAHVGHGHPTVVAAIQNQVAQLNTNTRYLHPNVCRLAQQLVKTLPSQLQVVYFVNSGSEANDLALRLARATSGTRNTIVVDHAYHGHTLGTLDVSPYKYNHSAEYSSKQEGVEPPGSHIIKVPCPDTYRGLHHDMGEEEAAESYAEYVRNACLKFNNKVGAFILEGGMSVGGVILPPASYIQKCVTFVRDAGGVYIADEVQTGFGRLGSCYWGFQYNSVQGGEDPLIVPDIVTVGKPFGNGMPLAAVITTRKIADTFESMGVEYFNTFGGNPVCAAAGLAMLDVIESESLQQNALTVGNYLKERLYHLQESTSCSHLIGNVRGSGLFVGVEFVRNRQTLEPATEETSFLCTILKETYAILTSIDGPHNNVLVIKPPMVFSKVDVDFFIQSLELAITHDLSSIHDITSISKTPT
eukprot:scaffold105004_cov52-Attheya_sp.AAC.2